jgi:hypothetical protein
MKKQHEFKELYQRLNRNNISNEEFEDLIASVNGETMKQAFQELMSIENTNWRGIIPKEPKLSISEGLVRIGNLQILKFVIEKEWLIISHDEILYLIVLALYRNWSRIVYYLFEMCNDNIEQQQKLIRDVISLWNECNRSDKPSFLKFIESNMTLNSPEYLINILIARSAHDDRRKCLRFLIELYKQYHNKQKLVISHSILMNCIDKNKYSLIPILLENSNVIGWPNNSSFNEFVDKLIQSSSHHVLRSCLLQLRQIYHTESFQRFSSTKTQLSLPHIAIINGDLALLKQMDEKDVISGLSSVTVSKQYALDYVSDYDFRMMNYLRSYKVQGRPTTINHLTLLFEVYTMRKLYTEFRPSTNATLLYSDVLIEIIEFSGLYELINIMYVCKAWCEAVIHEMDITSLIKNQLTIVTVKPEKDLPNIYSMMQIISKLSSVSSISSIRFICHKAINSPRIQQLASDICVLLSSVFQPRELYLDLRTYHAVNSTTATILVSMNPNLRSLEIHPTDRYPRRPLVHGGKRRELIPLLNNHTLENMLFYLGRRLENTTAFNTHSLTSIRYLHTSLTFSVFGQLALIMPHLVSVQLIDYEVNIEETNQLLKTKETTILSSLTSISDVQYCNWLLKEFSNGRIGRQLKQYSTYRSDVLDHDTTPNLELLKIYSLIPNVTSLSNLKYLQLYDSGVQFDQLSLVIQNSPSLIFLSVEDTSPINDVDLLKKTLNTRINLKYLHCVRNNSDLTQAIYKLLEQDMNTQCEFNIHEYQGNSDQSLWFLLGGCHIPLLSPTFPNFIDYVESIIRENALRQYCFDQ